jgi:hypothetical protein
LLSGLASDASKSPWQRIAPLKMSRNSSQIVLKKLTVLQKIECIERLGCLASAAEKPGNWPQLNSGAESF